MSKSNYDTDSEYELIIDNPERFYPKLSKDLISELQPVFCVGGLSDTHILSQIMRPLKLLNSVLLKYDLTKNSTLDDIINKMADIDIVVARRKVIDYIKIDNEYVLQHAKFKNIINSHCYYLSEITINNGDCIENVRPGRVFLLK